MLLFPSFSWDIETQHLACLVERMSSSHLSQCHPVIWVNFTFFIATLPMVSDCARMRKYYPYIIAKSISATVPTWVHMKQVLYCQKLTTITMWTVTRLTPLFEKILEMRANYVYHTWYVYNLYSQFLFQITHFILVMTLVKHFPVGQPSCIQTSQPGLG